MYDVIVIGSGIGGLSAAALLAQAGLKVHVLEANYLPGGCCSSYWRKGYIFETGATTLMGFDPGQPLDLLNRRLDLALEKQELDPAMTVWIDGLEVRKPKSREHWSELAAQTFGQRPQQNRFWHKTLALSDFVWKVSGRNLTFPPQSPGDLWQLARNNNPLDFPLLRYAFRSTQSVLNAYGLASNTRFRRFLDEQLLITAQAETHQTPFLFAAPALSYTNYRNYYLPGGMIRLAEALIQKLEQYGGTYESRKEVVALKQEAQGCFHLTGKKGETWQARRVLSNLPVWNMAEITTGPAQQYFRKQASRLNDYWGAFTMGIVVEDAFDPSFTLHNQVILPEGKRLPVCNARSIFVSASAPNDQARAPEGTRVLAISTHAENPAWWFGLDKPAYREAKQQVTEQILYWLRQKLPGFGDAPLIYQTDSSPVSWQKWIFRKNGTVGGIPQSLSRPLYTWQGAKTPYPGLYLCGDTTYPGQGIPGVALSGLISAERILRDAG